VGFGRAPEQFNRLLALGSRVEADDHRPFFFGGVGGGKIKGVAELIVFVAKDLSDDLALGEFLSRTH
jgi:hypothetical protein